MANQRLLERIASIDAGHVPPDGLKTLLESVRVYLSQLLNTHQGTAMIAEDYGVPDISLSLDGEALSNLEEVLAQVIVRYEPRLTQVTVRYQKDKSSAPTLAFRVGASIRGDSGVLPVFFETQIAADGSIAVQEA
ncbi:MAG: type VI secretion system baseplate subunit TssE [Burkholderiaceae bacterium]|nr:type VI secretion system baseplate subunit TssE [Burkholderiaceae bacterium]